MNLLADFNQIFMRIYITLGHDDELPVGRF